MEPYSGAQHKSIEIKPFSSACMPSAALTMSTFSTWPTVTPFDEFFEKVSMAARNACVDVAKFVSVITTGEKRVSSNLAHLV